MDKDAMCEKSVHKCRLVSDGMVCQRSCEWLDMQEPATFDAARIILSEIGERSKKAAA